MWRRLIISTNTETPIASFSKSEKKKTFSVQSFIRTGNIIIDVWYCLNFLHNMKARTPYEMYLNGKMHLQQ